MLPAAGFLDGQPREVVTIYEVLEEEDGIYVQPDYQFRFAGGPTGYPGPTTPCVTENVTVPEALGPDAELSFSNTERVYSGGCACLAGLPACLAPLPRGVPCAACCPACVAWAACLNFAPCPPPRPVPPAGNEVPCIDGKQTWARYDYPGVITSKPSGTEDYSIRGKFKIPANLHIGNIGLAPAYEGTGEQQASD